MPRTAIASLALATLALSACGTGHSSASVRSPQAGKVDPATFVARVDNPYFPLPPGLTERYRGVKDGKPAVDVFTVTHQTKRILGVATTVVRDRLYLRGKLEETTEDWYAQDRQGNVWYFGEATRTLGPGGKVNSTAGSFQAGVDGAQAGIFMPGRPRVGQTGRQEYYKGQAEDHYRIQDLAAPVKVPFVSSRRALKTSEWTPLEPGVLDVKYYVRGLGTVSEKTVRGGDEHLVLFAVNRR